MTDDCFMCLRECANPVVFGCCGCTACRSCVEDDRLASFFANRGCPVCRRTHGVCVELSLDFIVTVRENGDTATFPISRRSKRYIVRLFKDALIRCQKLTRDSDSEMDHIRCACRKQICRVVMNQLTQLRETVGRQHSLLAIFSHATMTSPPEGTSITFSDEVSDLLEPRNIFSSRDTRSVGA